MAGNTFYARQGTVLMPLKRLQILQIGDINREIMSEYPVEMTSSFYFIRNMITVPLAYGDTI